MSKKTKSRPPYKAPRVTKIGRLEKLTKAKRGTKQDGASKPSSRINGPSS